MRITLRIVCFHMLLLLFFIYGCTKDKKAETPSINLKEQTVVNEDPDCVEFIALWSSGDIAEKLGKDRKWVFLNYTVDLWDTPPTYGSGNIVGKLRASSYARIIEKRGNDYKVESPIGKVQGWLSQEHVKTTSWKNPNTRALCGSSLVSNSNVKNSTTIK